MAARRSRPCRASGAARRSGGSWLLRPYRLQVSTVLVAIVVTSLLGLVNPFLLKLLIDDAFPAGHFQNLNLYVGLMIIVPIVNGLIGVGQTYLNNSVGQHVMQDLRNALYAHLQRMPLRFFTETRTGEIQSRLANDVGGIQSVVTDTASRVVANIVTVISTIVAMVLIDWRLTAPVAGGSCRSSCTSPTASGKVRRTRQHRRRRRAWPTCRPSPRRRSASAACC